MDDMKKENKPDGSKKTLGDLLSEKLLLHEQKKEKKLLEKGRRIVEKDRAVYEKRRQKRQKKMESMNKDTK